MSVESADLRLKNGVVEKTLPNGLKVYIKEEHFAPVVAAYLWVKSGSVDELDEE